MTKQNEILMTLPCADSKMIQKQLKEAANKHKSREKVLKTIEKFVQRSFAKSVII